MTGDPEAAVLRLAASLHKPERKRQASGWPRCLCLSLGTLAAIILSCLLAAAQTKQVRRILILNEAGVQYPAIRYINDAIRESLQRSKYGVEIYSEYMDTNLFPDPADQSLFRDFYLRKYEHHRPDVIITVGSSPLRFMKEERDKHFAGIPVVFCEANGLEDDFKHEPGFTGVMMGIEAGTTLDAALQMLPGTSHVFVVSGGVSAFDLQEIQKVKQQLHNYRSPPEITYLTGLAMPVLQKRLSTLPPGSLVLLTSFGRDADGANFTSTESGSLISSAANAPVFTLFDVFIGHGEVGGNLSRIRAQGTIAASAVLKILDGVSPDGIPVAGANEFIFDWHALERWGLKESNVPPGSKVLNRQFTIWELYKWYIIVGLALLFAESILLLGLVWHREKRRRSERYSKELVLRSPVAMVVTRGPEHKNELINNRFTELFGYTLQDIPGEDHWWPLAYPDEEYRESVKAEWKSRVQRAAHDKTDMQPVEASVRCKDGSYRHIEFHFAAFGDSNVITFVDLTDRHRAEIQIRESEERFRLVANTAPVMIWKAGVDKACDYFNNPWLEFTGRSLEGELRDGWGDGIHPDDLSRCLRTYAEAFDRRESFEMQYRLRRHDGEYRWVLDKGVPRFNTDSSLAGYIGSCIDITERKLAEEAMSTMGRRLIEAHEEERTWIGRELHDDINQRLALLGVELDHWSQDSPPAELSSKVRHAQQRIIQIAKDVQGLSHRLHSSKLEYLGLAKAAHSFCRELSEQSNVEIQFTHSEVPRNLSKEISLCMFRVLQEALQNAVKHSGIASFTVDLHGTAESLQLTVSDTGKGFDEHDAFTRHGLGLISMRERLQLVRGELSVKSKPGAGTTIRARVPVGAAEYGAMAG